MSALILLIRSPSKLYPHIKCQALNCISIACNEGWLSNFSSRFKRRCFHTSSVNPESSKKDVSGKLSQVYDAAAVESEWYQWWEKEGFFKLTQRSENSKPFTMILPPPNITGTLHLGHALTVTVQDVIARWRRMTGQDVLWIPGTDHAGIATQVVVEKQLWTQRKVTRHQLGRQKFIEEIRYWQKEKGSHIQNQLRLMGASLDWSREYFTMDETQSSAVVEAFIRLFDEELIYRNNIPVSWSCCLQSTISDIEIDHHEIDGPTTLPVPGYEKPVLFGTLTNIVYKGFENDTEIVVSTTRPETMLGDVAIAVHPEDPRYFHLHGSFFWHPYRNEKIPLICDDFVDQKFGTGAVKITPAHDKNDFEVAKRHNLQQIPVFTGNGTISKTFSSFQGMKRFNARELLLKDLSSRGLLQGDCPHKMIIPICSRSGDVVELIPKPQWFLSTKEMAQKAISAVKENRLRLVPKQAEKFWNQWFENHQDWCLSRQLWWGHRIPAYKCCLLSDTSEKWFAAKNEQDARSKASSYFSCQPDDPRLVVKQDEDVLDTWFSSSILPLSALGWPENVRDMKKFYPLSLMETGNDILLFWVARMIILGEHLTQSLPFNDVFLHGMIRDASGRKMSKSVGNVVSPEDIREGRSLKELEEKVIESHKLGIISSREVKNAISNQQKMFPRGIQPCGTDALRLSLCCYPIESQFIDFNVKHCDSFRRFCNKIWQAFRYMEGVMEQSETLPQKLTEHEKCLSVMDLWILSKLSTLIVNLDQSLSQMHLHECVEGFQTFVHLEFCDVYLEYTKRVLQKGDSESVQAAKFVLALCAENILAVLAPFMPFITEELYQRTTYINRQANSIMMHPYPQPSKWLKWKNPDLEREINLILTTAGAIRKLKNMNGMKMKEMISVLLKL
ncbi:hypothetical protein ONE63_010281 [Megalurothrips usitatus]|uniref:valine--tRNA ligase n=1 Tax=Megalurothrips usitatus TaxID=439358 RepID=A0AAV7XLG6_9NEOP|nr:hypothetical protein ONE63_010281 [Megalurothrips usitatus]